MSEYREILPRVVEMIRPRRVEELSSNTLTLPEAFDRASTRKAQAGQIIPGWDYFNGSTRGLRNHEFTILCGPTGAGKTTLLANLYMSFVSMRVPTFAAPVEVGPEDFLQKCASIISNRATVDDDEAWKDVRRKYFGTFFGNPMHVISNYDSRVPHTQLMCDLLRCYETKGTRIALIDNLNFMMEADDGRNAIAKMDKVIHEWIQFVKKLPLHVVMVMHPRKNESGRVESEFDIKGSSTAIQEAQNVLLFNKLKADSDAPMGKEARYCREIKIAKCRKNGRATGTKIIFSLDAISEKYTELSVL